MLIDVEKRLHLVFKKYFSQNLVVPLDRKILMSYNLNAGTNQHNYMQGQLFKRNFFILGQKIAQNLIL